MTALARVFVVKIAATVLFWCVPLLLFPTDVLVRLGIPEPGSLLLFVRLLGWAYLALCVGYGFGLAAALKGQRAMGSIAAGIVSNGGASLYLCYFGLSGAWSDWGGIMPWLLWASAAVTGLLAVLLYWFGVRGRPEPTDTHHQ
ncbi:hypothetical protein C7S18_11180 [Ahniella affigens]|uniref:Uncharacterized protein n=1 Tax=Ahniella affigens TaxID=2021234 RepID=A0A2P1PS92_9GAMM|nr:hypothetical protein [Ahniella affigens]AVP97726.1 hypothetical protein C7S18_11180 [Ahniella affigens]